MKRLLIAVMTTVLRATVPTPAQAQEPPELPGEEIAGPAGSVAFGSQVVVLPNGNFVVTDPSFTAGGISGIGAVHLYDGVTLELISTLTGSTTGDGVGNSGITVLAGGDFVVPSPTWDSPAAIANVGAVTLCGATTGCAGTVSDLNSLVGSSAGDLVGLVRALPGGDYAWLVPGRHAGRTIGPVVLGERLQAIGIEPRRMRNTARAQLAAEIPPALLGELLGVSAQTATRWAGVSAGNWTAYAGDLVSG